MDDVDHDFHWPKIKDEVKSKNLEWWDSKIKLIERRASILNVTDSSYTHEVKIQKNKKRLFRQSQLCLHKSSTIESPSFANTAVSNFGYELRQFIKKPMEDVRIWRKVPKITDICTFNKYKMMEKQIRSYFLNMYNENMPNQGESIENVFDSMFSTAPHPMSNSVKITSKLIPIVPDATVKRFHPSQLTRTQCIKRMIHKDIAEENQKNKTRLASRRTVPENCVENSLCKLEIKSKLLKFYHTHKELETFSCVWNNILELETTRKFCGWLAANPHINPPAYLVNKGMLGKLQSISDNPSLLVDSDNYDEFNAAYALKQELSGLSLKSNELSDTLSSISSLESLDISDINIIV